jgi:hypothetical protein
MNFGIAICLSALIAVMVAIQYSLHQLAESVELSSFLLICLAIFATTVALAFAWDWHEARSRRR